jgi:hypothetical protein
MRNRSGSFGMRAARFVRHPTAGVPSASHAWVRSACAPLGSFGIALRSGSFGMRAARVRPACAPLGFVRHAQRSGSFGFAHAAPWASRCALGFRWAKAIWEL